MSLCVVLSRSANGSSCSTPLARKLTELLSNESFPLAKAFPFFHSHDELSLEVVSFTGLALFFTLFLILLGRRGGAVSIYVYLIADDGVGGGGNGRLILYIVAELGSGLDQPSAFKRRSLLPDIQLSIDHLRRL